MNEIIRPIVDFYEAFESSVRYEANMPYLPCDIKVLNNFTIYSKNMNINDYDITYIAMKHNKTVIFEKICEFSTVSTDEIIINNIGDFYIINGSYHNEEYDNGEYFNFLVQGDFNVPLEIYELFLKIRHGIKKWNYRVSMNVEKNVVPVQIKVRFKK